MKKHNRLVSLTPPAVPIWGVFYEEDEPDRLLILPVLGLALVEVPERDDSGNREIYPLVFDREYGISFWSEDISTLNDCLGFLLREELSKAAEIFADEIIERKRAPLYRK